MSYSIYIGEAALEIPDKRDIEDCNLDKESFFFMLVCKKLNCRMHQHSQAIK